MMSLPRGSTGAPAAAKATGRTPPHRVRTCQVHVHALRCQRRRGDFVRRDARDLQAGAAERKAARPLHADPGLRGASACATCGRVADRSRPRARRAAWIAQELPDETVTGIDTDSDGVVDCLDGCPADPNKTDPGRCGCGVVDTTVRGDFNCDGVYDQADYLAMQSDLGICPGDLTGDGQVDGQDLGLLFVAWGMCP